MAELGRPWSSLISRSASGRNGALTLGGVFLRVSERRRALRGEWSRESTAAELPTQLSADRPVRSSWNFNVTQNNTNTLNVAYDLWLHDIPNPDWQNQPTDEVMVWLYRAGGAGPLGTKVANLNIGGANWDLYQGDIGWKVHSFVRTSNTTAANLNLTDFTNALVNRGSMARSKYLSSVQAGTEVFQGRGQLDTNSYSVTVG